MRAELSLHEFHEPLNLRPWRGILGRRRGRMNESRVLHACLVAERPDWMRSIRRATHDEDHAGIDLVVESDIGKLFVQVKSSRTGKLEYLARRRPAKVAIVVAMDRDSQDALFRKVFGELAKLRAALVKERAPKGRPARYVPPKVRGVAGPSIVPSPACP